MCHLDLKNACASLSTVSPQNIVGKRRRIGYDSAYVVIGSTTLRGTRKLYVNHLLNNRNRVPSSMLSDLTVLVQLSSTQRASDSCQNVSASQHFIGKVY